MLKFFFLKTTRWMKLLLFIHAYVIILFINCVLFRSGKNLGCYGNFFIVVVILGQQSIERLKDHWSYGNIISFENLNETLIKDPVHLNLSPTYNRADFSHIY